MKVAVIGAGPAGCAATYTLRKNGHEVYLFEAQEHIGGRTSQIQRDGFNLGTGALFLMGGIYPRTNAILKELGKYKELVPWDAKAHIIDRDQQRYLVSFDQVMSFLKLPVFSLGEKISIAYGVLKQLFSAGPKSCFDGAELAKYDHGESLQGWSERVLGDKATQYITLPYMGFLYAVPLSWLSTSLFQAVVQQFYKLSLSVPPKGMGQISEWMIEGAQGVHLNLSSKVESLCHRGGKYVVASQDRELEVDAVVLASEPGVSATLLQGLVPDSVCEILRGCTYSEYAHVQVCYKKNPWPDFPVSLALPGNQVRSWGACVLQSRRHPGAVPPGGEAVGVYFYTPPLKSMSEEDIKREALLAVTEVFGSAPEPSFVEVFYYKRGLSIAVPGHYAKMNSIHGEVPQGIYLAGDYFAHAGVEAAIYSGELAANRLERDLV
ncbi:NAD(P)/FAD-dependent oxidoreductase [Pseudomonas sp. R3.Fl]|uniref:protoporphyrinogen/coproporphyrinogen oxidase n=1 Tax=Pseudomonas sp. R3.Fl TaxID=2928708 RepID=UPI0024C1A374|nr:NAD(P)/FAD-dependent oxidoreductase [Pseudomonas sp. R3.Fl]